MKPAEFYRVEEILRYVLESMRAIERDVARNPDADGVIRAFHNYKIAEKMSELNELIYIVPPGLEVLQTLHTVLCEYVYVEYRMKLCSFRTRPAEKQVGVGTLLYHLDLVGLDFEKLRKSRYFGYEEKLLPIAREIVGLVANREYYNMKYGASGGGLGGAKNAP